MTPIAQLSSPDILDGWKAAIANDEQFDDGQDALEFVRFYEKFLRSNPTFLRDAPEVAGVYEDLYARALWLALPYLGEKEGIAVFEKRLAAGVANPNIDLGEKTRQWLTNVILLERRDELKKQLVQILQNSQAEVTSKPVGDGGAEKPGTVAHWLRHYRSAVGAGEADPLAQSQYFFGNRSFTALPPAEQERLKKLFVFVERLGKSSLTPEGFEEDIVVGDGEATVTNIFEGKVVEMSEPMRKALRDVLRPPTPEEEAKRLIELLKGSEEERATIRKNEEAYANDLGADEAKIRDALFRLVTPIPGQRVEALRAAALLRYSARSGKLEEVLQSDKRFLDLLVKHYQETGRQQRVDDLKVYPTSPSHISTFLQLILSVYAGIPSAEAARFAVQIANIMKQRGKEKYLQIAFFDDETDRFQFAEPLRKK